MNKKIKAPFFDKAYLKKVGLYIAVTLLAICAILYIGYHISGSMKETISIMYARSETISQSVTGQAYIIRDESPIDDNVGGYLSPVLRDGSKVRIGDRVADVYSTSSAVTESKIALLEEQIAFYEKCRNSHLSVGDSSAVHKELSTDILSLRRAAESGNISSALSLKSSLALDIRRLGVLTGKVSDIDGRISALTTELNSLKATMGSVIKTIYAPSSGYYFSYTDGYEGVFSSANIDGVTYSDVIDMIERASVTEDADGNTTAGKIVNSFKWYVACRMSASDASRYTVGYSYDVILKNNAASPVTMKMYKTLTNGTEAVALFECSVMPESFDYTRSQSYEIVYDEVTGFKVPISAVRIHDGYEGVYILDEVTVKFRRISVIGEENGNFLCEIVTEDSESEETTSETGDTATTGDDEPYYAYLRENDVIIKSGTGLHVGMTYNP